MIDYDSLLRKHTADNLDLYNLLKAHSNAVAKKALLIASRHPELGVDVDFVLEAAMLHDIGVTRCDAPSIHCFGSEPYLRHGIIGAEILREEGLPLHARVAERHTGAGITAEDIRSRSLPLPEQDYLPDTVEEKLICYADKFFSKSRRPDEAKPLEKIRTQMQAFGADTLARFDEMLTLFEKRRILFVCLGNICRSPAAEEIARSIAKERGVEAAYEFDSAGLYSGHYGQLPDKRMRVHALQRGYNLTHRARTVKETDFDYFDTIVAMDAANHDTLRQLAPTTETQKKIVMMADYLNRPHGYDYIPDPYYEGAEGFELVLDMLEDACSSFFN